MRITESLDLEIRARRWRCNRCDCDLGPAEQNYKEACLLFERNPTEIHQRFVGNPEFSYAPDQAWCAIVEIYCPQCGVMLDLEYLPPGHPITHDVELDLGAIEVER